MVLVLDPSEKMVAEEFVGAVMVWSLGSAGAPDACHFTPYAG